MFFFFKQKTAYEMRISDWSSDVCSSDLRRAADSTRLIGLARARARWQDRPMERRITHSCGHEQTHSIYGMFAADAGSIIAMRLMTDCSCLFRSVTSPDRLTGLQQLRSEEHTSELQSLMRISYAVFCLKKKKP